MQAVEYLECVAEAESRMARWSAMSAIRAMHVLNLDSEKNSNMRER